MAEEKRVCCECVTEPYLRQAILAAAIYGECDYCGKELPTTSIGDLAEECDRVIEKYFEVSSLTDAVVHYARDPSGDRLEDIVESQLPAGTAVLEDVVKTLEEMWTDTGSMEEKYGDDPYFIERSHLGSSYGAEWRTMVESLKVEARLFNPRTSVVLEKVFGPVLNDRTRVGAAVIFEAGPGTELTTLFRARVFQALDILEDALSHPEREIGAPPPGVGRAGRMNAKGISVFYGATKPEIAVAEVRPPVGSHVVVGRFTVRRPLKLLDLNGLADLTPDRSASYFDPATEDVVARHEFLRSLCDQMVVPVMPEFEDDGYLITQLVADFLATHADLALDGILFRSVQHHDPSGEGRNVVLFNKASRTEGADLDASNRVAYVDLFETDEDGEHWMPQITYKAKADWETLPPWATDPEKRIISLTLDVEALVVEYIESVRYSSEHSKVLTTRMRPTAELQKRKY